MCRCNLVICAVVAALLSAPRAGAQERTIVSNEVEVSESTAALRLEFSDGERFSVVLADGDARVDGTRLPGSYEVGGAADREWRALLSGVLSLSDGPLALELERWRPDPRVGGDDRSLLVLIEYALDRALAGAVPVVGTADVASQAQAGESAERLLRAMARSENREGLAAALEGLDLEGLDIVVDEDHVVPGGTLTEAGLLLAGGKLDVRGHVRGDVIVVDGTLTLASGGRIDGEVRLVDARLERRGGEVGGDIVDVTNELRQAERRIRDRIRAEVQRELGREVRDSPRSSGWLATRIRLAARATFHVLVNFLAVGLLGWIMVRWQRNRVGVVTRAIAHQPARSAVVGFAGGFMTVPAYLIGILALVASLAGIPALIFWLPLFPLAVAAGGLIGLVGVSHHVGRWVLAQDFRWLERADRKNPSHARLVGLATLFAPFVAGNALRILPFANWVSDLLLTVGALGLLLAVVTGFGAVILTRGGRRPTRWADDFEEYGDDRRGDTAVDDAADSGWGRGT